MNKKYLMPENYWQTYVTSQLNKSIFGGIKSKKLAIRKNSQQSTQ